ncbi:MAG: DUF6263 family protein [Planctomycetota bacterium]
MLVWIRRARLALWLGALLSCFATVAPADAQAPLTWKFTPGESLYYSVVQDRHLSTIVDGNTTEETMVRTTDFTLVVDSILPNGSARVRQTVDRIRLKAASPRGKVDFDSNSTDNQAANITILDPTLGRMVGTAFQFTLSPLGKITDVEATEATKNRFRDLPNAEAILDPKALKAIIPVVLLFPEKPPEMGGTWTEKIETSDAILGKRSILLTYKLEGIVERDGRALQQIAVDQSVTLTPKVNPLVKVSLKDARSQGTALFDNQAGRLVEREVKEDLVLEISGAGRNIEQRGKSVITTKLTGRLDAEKS